MSLERQDISVVSSYATDRLINAATMQVIKEQRGGPVLYIVQALQALGLEPRVYTGEEMLVEILVREDDEFGKIHEARVKNPLPKLHTDSTIVSTLLDEWDLSKASDYSGKLFVDIQGYVRDGSAFGRKKAWEDITVLAPAIFCLKGNDVEVGMLPQEVIADQSQNRMLIITKDSAGVEIHYKNERYDYAPQQVMHPPHTIGAGDTWFANFVAKFIATEDVTQSANFAMDKTSEFLQNIK